MIGFRYLRYMPAGKHNISCRFSIMFYYKYHISFDDCKLIIVCVNIIVIDVLKLSAYYKAEASPKISQIKRRIVAV